MIVFFSVYGLVRLIIDVIYLKDNAGQTNASAVDSHSHTKIMILQCGAL